MMLLFSTTANLFLFALFLCLLGVCVCVCVCVLLSFCMSSVFLLSRVLFCNFALSLHRLDTPLAICGASSKPGLESLPTVCCWFSLILKDPLSNFSLVVFNLLMSLPSHNRSMPNENVFTQRPKDHVTIWIYMVCTCALRYVYGNPFGP